MTANILMRVSELGIDVSSIPDRIIKKAIVIADKLAAGASLASLKAKKLERDKTVVSVPIGSRWRMLCSAIGDSIKPVCVLSHEAYNKKVSQLKGNRTLSLRNNLSTGDTSTNSEGAADMKELTKQVKIFDCDGNIYIFAAPNKHLSSATDIMTHGLLIAHCKKGSNQYFKPDGTLLDAEESNFRMMKLVKLSTGREKEAFIQYLNKHLKVANPKVELKPVEKVEPVKLVVKVEQKPELVEQLTEKEHERLPETATLDDKVRGLHELAKDIKMRTIFESFVGRARKVANPQYASNLMMFCEKHHGMNLEKKDVMKFFTELQRLGFGRYSSGPKNKSGFVPAKNMIFSFLPNYTAEAVAYLALEIDNQLAVNPTPVKKPAAKAARAKKAPEVTDKYKLLEVELNELKKELDSVNSKLSLSESNREDDMRARARCKDELRVALQNVVHYKKIAETSAKLIEEQAEEIAKRIMAPTFITSTKQSIEKVEAWLLKLAESGERGDLTTAWAVFHKLTAK